MERPAITRELNGIPVVYCDSLALTFLRFDRPFYLSQVQQEAIIKRIYAVHACGEGSVTSGIIIIEPEMKSR